MDSAPPQGSAPNFGSYFSTQTLPLLSGGGPAGLGIPKQANKDRNYLNHHPYGTFYYSKKNGRCGIRKNNGNKARPSSSYSNANNVRACNKHQQNKIVLAAGSSSNDDSSGNGNNNNGALVNDKLQICNCKRCITRAMNNPEKALNSVSKIDKISRVVFPATFLTLNMFYWYSYLKHSERIDLSFES